MPITPKWLDYAVKVGITTNTETWTDEEKAAACETIGAVEAIKESEITGSWCLYGTDESALEKLNFVTDEYGNNLGVMYMPYKDGVEYQSGNENKVYGANNTVIQEYEIVRKLGGDS